jgi:hypothetical protein
MNTLEQLARISTTQGLWHMHNIKTMYHNQVRAKDVHTQDVLVVVAITGARQ